MAPITSLPLHLLADILRMVGSVQHLPAILRSHRIFYTAFLDTPCLPADLLRLQLPDHLLPLALAAYTSQKSIRDKHGVDPGRFLTECYGALFNAIGGGGHYITLDQALHISRLDDALTKLRSEFCESTLQKLYGLDRDDPISAVRQGLSDEELYRISRALYRFQIYGNLFLDQEDAEKTGEAQKALFFGRHSPWVNEQLACIYDYLETRLTGVMLTILSTTPACQEVVVNGFQWGGNLTEWLTERSQLFEEQRCVSAPANHLTDREGKPNTSERFVLTAVDWQLSLGLPRLHRLLQATTCEEWQSSLEEASTLCKSSLEDDLNAFNRGTRPEGAADGVWKAEEMDRLARQVEDGDETDDQPRKMWSKANYDGINDRFRLGAHASSPMRFVYGLRAVGYVLWDGERMDDEACKKTVAKAYRGDPIF
ncbi:hypothetical protein B0J13DRAFT_518748 [Dactylonectria estremocensis]|uniref:Uncharacterized protein n=1 Tax=Dactylonectria estremocensis TaxID=1079267 RepID=A0A9P9FKQ3_9HYPO|nr:hypothetical protein B0J13DRAFT_518748 [Dactylonectria estremocensis]